MQFDTAIPIGEGGTGRVLKAHDRSRGFDVAVKLLERGRTARLAREASAQQRLDHPHICPVFEVGRYNDTPCIVMRYIDGAPITDALALASLEERLEIFLQVLEAVDYAHRHGVVHRDLKPGNILVERRDDASFHAWLVDFGLAKAVDDTTLTVRGEAFGTPGYMAPEQATGEKDVDERADVFSLGAVLFELISGRPPFSGDSAAQILLGTVNRDAPSLRSVDPNAPEPLARIVAQCLERQPALRYATVGDLSADLRAFLHGKQVKARRYGLWHRSRRITAANPGATLAVGGLFIAALILAMVALWADMAGDRFAAEQAAAAGRFGNLARRIESEAALIHARPLHDSGDERASLTRELFALESDIPTRGPAQRTARLAMGRAWVAIGEYERALDHLLAAPTGRDSRVDPIHGLLGRTYAQLYFAGEDRAFTLPDAAMRDRELETARQTWLQPAVRHLRMAVGPGAEQPLLNRALLAWLEDDQDEALETLREARMMTYWPVEPLMLAGRIEVATAHDREAQGDLESALAHYSSAHGAFQEVTELARSYAEAYRADCRLAGRMANLRIQGHEPDAQAFEEARLACQHAVDADPDNPQSLLAAAISYEHIATALNTRREDPKHWVARARTLAQRATKLAEADPAAFRVLAGLELVTARWRLTEEVLARLREAVRLAERAAKLDGGRAESLLLLGQAHQFLARALYLGGDDGDPHYAAAVEALQRAIPVSPTPVRIRARLSEALAWQGYYRSARGREARDVLQRSVDVARKLASDAPNHIEAWISLGYAAWTLADYRYLIGVADGTVAAEADDAYSRVLEMDPTRFATRYNAQGPLAIMARVRLSQGQSAADLIHRMRQLGESLREDFGDRASLELLFAQIDMLDAWQSRTEDRIDDALKQLRPAKDGAVAALETVDSLEAAQLIAEIALFEYRWRIDGGSPIDDLESDLELLFRLTRQYPELARLHARVGELHLVARGVLPEKSEHTKMAASFLADALERNPLLRSRHKASLDRAMAATVEEP